MAAVCRLVVTSPEPRDEIDAHAILMTIEPILLVATLIGGALVFALGVFLGRMIGRPVSETSLRETFRALSHEALKSNNESFLSLAETKLGEARAKAAAEIDQRKAAIENLLTPMAKQAAEVHKLTLQHNNIHFQRWRQIQVPLAEGKSPRVQKATRDLMAALDEEEADVVKEQRASAQPRRHEFQLAPK